MTTGATPSTIDYAAAAGWKLGDGRQVLVEVVATFEEGKEPERAYPARLEATLLEALPQIRRQPDEMSAAREVALTLRKVGVPTTWVRVTLSPLSWVAYKPLGG